MTIGKRVAGTNGILTALAALLGLVCLISLNEITSSSHRVADSSLHLLHEVQGIILAGRDQKLAMLTHIGSLNAKQMADQEVVINDHEAKIQADLDAFARDAVNDSDRQAAEDYKTYHAQLMTLWQKVLPLSRAGKNDQAFRMFTEEGRTAISGTAQTSARLTESINSQLSQKTQNVLTAAESARLWCWLLLGACVVIGVLLSLAVVKSISRILDSAVLELGQGANQVAIAAKEIASSSQSLAQGTSEQAASLEETSASSEEMTSMTRKNADNSQQCAKLMVQVDARVIAANQTLEQMVHSMQEINTSSDKISKIIKVIDEIAFQTNILALNAAVEAARAGEAGMGFAVVADEVRTLAQRSAQAAKDTAVLIEESITRSSEGSARLTQVSDAISTITQSTNQVKTLVDEVNLGSQEQARGAEQISKAIMQIERVTQQAAASSEEAASAGEKLSAQVGAIRSIVTQLESLVGGSQTAVAVKTRKSTPKKVEKPASMTRSLSVLKAATAAKSPVKMIDHLHAPPAFVGTTKSERNPIPMDDDFKEF